MIRRIRGLGLLLVLIVRPLLDYLVVFGAFNHADLAKVGQEIGPHDMMLHRRVKDKLRADSDLLG